jgi:hypothetical protein
MFLVKQVFADKDGSTGILYLVSSDITLIYEQITTIYRKRRNVECYHNFVEIHFLSLKQNASSEKSPAKVCQHADRSFFCFRMRLYQT